MKKIRTEEPVGLLRLTLIVCTLIAAVFGGGSAVGRHDGTPGGEVDGAHVERPDGPSWEGRPDAPD